MPVPFVRAFNPAQDFENGLHVFLVTIEPALDQEPTRTIGSYLWYRAYVCLTPATCFVLDDGAGRAVGYCIGTSNTLEFAEKWRKEFASSVDLEPVPKAGVETKNTEIANEQSEMFRLAVQNAECSALQAWPQELKRYPAHMHIDILPEYQRQGWGSKLIQALFDAVKREGAPGIHLDMVKWNTVGRNFYEKLGFERCSLVLDGGQSGEVGVNDVVLTLVRVL